MAFKVCCVAASVAGRRAPSRLINRARASGSGLRDPNDLPILALLLGSDADHLITGDKDLLALANTYPILTPAEFVDRFVP